MSLSMINPYNRIEKDNITNSGLKQSNENAGITDAIKSIITSLEFYWIIFLAYQELVFHFVRVGAEAEGILYKLLFAGFYGLVIGGLTGLLPDAFAKLLNIILTIIISLYYIVQIIYSGVFSTYLSVSGSLQVTGQALDFTDVILHEIKSEWWILLLMLLPVAVSLLFARKRLSYKRHSIIFYGLQLAAAIMILTVAVVSMNDDEGVYSAYDIYTDYTSVDMAMNKLGVMETLYLDTKAGITERLGGNKKEVRFIVENFTESDTTEDTAQTDDASNVTENSSQNDAAGNVTEDTAQADAASNVTENSSQNDAAGDVTEDTAQADDADNTTEKNTEAATEQVVDTSPNVLDIDFNRLIEGETNSNIASLHAYVDSVTPTNKNEYTGMFEGYNLIFVVAEGFSGYAVDRVRTPMLYQMSRKGFYFENYYTPLWYGSTIGGEYADLTGLMPKNGSYLSMNKVGRNGNDMMFTLGNQLSRIGYTTLGFHDNDYTYYDRNISHPYLGYEWTGMGNGLAYEKDDYGNTLWPQSDLSMIQDTFDLYKDETPFHVYYLTVSGHVMYNFTGNAMAKKNQDVVADLDYSDTTKAYLACQYELELAMEELVADLEEAGLADNTLIVLTADHVPYDNKEVLDELAGYTLEDTFEWYKNTLIIWSPSMEKSVKVSKYCSSLDILPTVSNLMGLDYDSRMLVGQDILSDSEGMVIFNDRSFITDRCSYNAATGEVKSFDGKAIDEEYIQNKLQQVKNKFNMAELICNYDYYKYIDEAVYGTSDTANQEAAND